MTPELLNDVEACAFFRMKKTAAQARRTMQHYRDSKKIKGIRIGKQWLYHIDELRRFVAEKMKEAA